MIFQKFGNMKFAYRNREFWCKGYYVDTVGKNTKAIKEYKFVCQKCLNRFASNKLQIHHINHNEGDNSKRNLLVVCKNCHEKIHNKEGGVFIDS